MPSYLLLICVLNIVLCVSTEGPGHANTTVRNSNDISKIQVTENPDGINTTKVDPDKNETIDYEIYNENTSKQNTTNIIKLRPPTKSKNVSSVAGKKRGKPEKDKKDIWKNYDQVGAKNFIVVTVVVYSLVGTLSLLLMRMCRRAQRIHNKTDRSDELVDQYLRACMDLKAQGYKERMLREKKKTCLTLISIEEEQLEGQGRRTRYHHQRSVLTDVDADDVFVEGEYESCLPSPSSKPSMEYDELDSGEEHGELSQQCSIVSSADDNVNM